MSVGGGTVSATDMRHLWEEVKAAVLRRFGRVSVAKFMHQPDDEAAALIWIDHTVVFLGGLSMTVLSSAVVADSEPLVTFSTRVRVVFDLGRFTVAVDGRDVWRASLRPRTAVLIIDALGQTSWGSRWDHALSAIDANPGPVVRADDDEARDERFPWVAQYTAGNGPWTLAATEHDAHRAARVEALGVEVVSALYERMEAEDE